MRVFHKKTVILGVAVITVFLLALSAARGKYQFPLAEKTITSLLAPVQSVFVKVGYSLRQTVAFTGELITVYHANQTLKAENEQLRQSGLNVAEVIAENTRLRAMLDYKKEAPQFDFVVAAVVARDPSTWTNIIVINKGSNHGLTRDMPAVTAQGLAGNVVQVFSNSARIQLILDPRSAVGCLVQRPESRVAAIVEGNAAKPMWPRMVNLARDADIIKGDKIITSGFGGIYPKGLLVGEVVDVVNEEGGLLKYAVLKPAVDFDRLEEVMIITQSRELVPAPAQGQFPADRQQAAPKGAVGR